MLVEDGRLTAFVTAMTGELFAVLRAHSVLAVDGPDDDVDAFDDGVEAAGDGDALAARLFGVRARVIGMGAPAASTPAFLSGLLIGADVASSPRLLGGAVDEVALLGEPGLTALYARALTRRGIVCQVFDGQAAALSGLSTLHGATRRRR
jgi:2-dehydro-3-deoxygalactonokinase